MNEFIYKRERIADGIYSAESTGEEIVRCRDCKYATISTLGFCKYCEMWVMPDVDGYGCDSQVNLPLDFFCAYGKRKEGGDD